MFGRLYHHKTDVLEDSFHHLQRAYRPQTNQRPLALSLKRLYVRLFGIPEIGFQLRSVIAQKMITHHVKQDAIARVLDAGCGIGAHVFWLAKTYPRASVVGGDIDKKKLGSARELASLLAIRNVSFTYFDVENVTANKTYDLIVSIDVLEHVANYQKALVHFSRLLRRKGYLYIHVPQPNQKRIFRALEAWRHNDHVREGVSPKELQHVLRTLGFVIIEIRETFGFWGKLAWELNHLALSHSLILGGVAFLLVYPLAMLDALFRGKNGLGVAVLAQKG